MSYQAAQGLRICRSAAIWALAVGSLPAEVGRAHVRLSSPNGGESLTGGAEFAIEWQVEVEHNTLDWDLWYSAESSGGPWEVLAADLAVGDKQATSIHTFDWSIPALELPTAWVRVRQDNAGEDYYDVSDASFLITTPVASGDFTGDGTVDVADLTTWEQGFGSRSALRADGDADLDADVDGADFLVWQNEHGIPAFAVTSQPVPEPAATVLLLLGMIFLLWQRR